MADSAVHIEPNHANGAQDPLEVKIAAAGDRLLNGLGGVVGALGRPEGGPQQLATRLGVDKVLASRLLKALRTADPVSAIHRMPGPEPLRRLIRASAKVGVDEALIDQANEAVDQYDSLIRDDIGDRTALDAIISAWIPEARREFELRRKQAAFRALSQLHGAQAGVIVATVMFHPSPDNEHIDVVWLNGLLGLQRLRPNAGIKIASRRFAGEDGSRAPRTLDGSPVDRLDGLLLADFCSKPIPKINIDNVGEVVHYSLGQMGYGPRSAVDLLFAEANRGELERFVPEGENRRRFVFAEVSTPARAMQFDAFIHRDLGGAAEPRLEMYDTSFEGVASVNDRTRDIDRLHLLESVESLGWGISSTRSPDVPRYSEALGQVLERVGWNPDDLHGFRCRSDNPLYGSQLTMSWEPQARG